MTNIPKVGVLYYNTGKLGNGLNDRLRLHSFNYSIFSENDMEKTELKMDEVESNPEFIGWCSDVTEVKEALSKSNLNRLINRKSIINKIING